MILNILFTSVGRRVELMHAFRKAYESLGIRGNVVGIDADPLAPALQACDRRYIVPPVTSHQYISVLKQICENEEVSLIFPLIDPDIPVLAQYRDLLEQRGARLCVVPEASLNVVSDKWHTAEFFQRLGLGTPESWLPEHLDRAHLKFPLFIKPRCGSASKNAFRVDNPRQLDFFLEYVPHPIIQEFLAGPDITSDVVATPDRELLAVVSRKRLEVRTGEVAKGVTIRDQRVLDACVKIAGSLPAVGPITVQCLMRGTEPCFTEINARFGGGLPLGIAAGVDSPKFLLARALNIPIDLPPLGSYQEGLYITRFDGSFFLNPSDYDKVSRSHI